MSDDVVFVDLDVRYLDGSEDPFTVESERGDTLDINDERIRITYGKREHVESEEIEITRSIVARISRRRRVISRQRYLEILEEMRRANAEIEAANRDQDEQTKQDCAVR